MKVVGQDIHFAYGSREVLGGVSMEIRPGQVASIVGPNGSGKTTLLRCLARVLTPRSGAVFLDGRELARIGSRELGRLVGYVPQDSGSILPFTVLETVIMGRKPYITWGVSPHDLEVVAGVLQFMGIAEMAQRVVGELSGGQRQLVFIARALAQEPRVLLLDEPTNNLDIQHQLRALEMVREFAGHSGRSAVMAMHDLNLAARFSDEIVMLREGRVFAAGAPESVLTAENIGVVYGVDASVINTAYGPYILPIRPAVSRVGGRRPGNGLAGSLGPASVRSGREP